MPFLLFVRFFCTPLTSLRANSHVRRRFQARFSRFEQNISRSMNPWVGWGVCMVSCTVESGVDARRLVVGNRRPSGRLVGAMCLDSLIPVPTPDTRESRESSEAGNQRHKIEVDNGEERTTRSATSEFATKLKQRRTDFGAVPGLQARPVCPVVRTRGARWAL